MTIAKEAVYALHQRLKDLSINAPADQLAYLAKALESIAGHSTVYDIVNMSDEKLQELLDAATAHLANLNTNKTSALSAIDSAKTSSIDAINTNKTTSLTALQTATTTNLSLLDARKDTNITAINTTGQTQLQALNTLVSNFSSINDVPANSTIMTEVRNRNMIETGALPFIFGVLSRQNDYWGYGDLTSQLGVWYNNVANADSMLQLLAGSHAQTTNYAGFYKPPQLHFLQGSAGNFIYKEMYVKYAVSTNEYTYPYAGLGVIFIKNTTAADITRTVSFGGSTYWSSGYEGMGLFVATPNNTNANKSSISGLTWTNLYNNATSTANIASSASVVIPAGKTVAILLYTSAYYYTGINSYYAQFLHWYIFSFRNGFLTTGLEVDIDRTLRAWQCRGFQYSYELWK
ncbi:MAG: hypothetical protein FJ186_03570 [Gammaproteobacteria bacterium]|nr:hypothetical protein [Gammaproteobacteria bacterium]